MAGIPIFDECPSPKRNPLPQKREQWEIEQWLWSKFRTSKALEEFTMKQAASVINEIASDLTWREAEIIDEFRKRI